MNLEVREYREEDYSLWESFVEKCDEATFFHRALWGRVLQEAFGHRPYFLLAERSGEIEGILPMTQVKSVLFGHSLSSLPFCVYGGIAATTEEARALLREAACALARRMEVDTLEFRNLYHTDSGWTSKELYYTFRKTLHSDNERNLKEIPNRQRAMVRKGIAAGLEGVEVAGTERIYRVYSESVRNLGTPIFSRKYLDILREAFQEDCRVLMIKRGNDDVAGVLSFYFKDEVLPYYGGSIAQAREIKGCNHFMYWDLMRRSAEEGIRGFDFGRSKAGTGPFSFKKNFGFPATALPYEYYLVNASEVPNLSPTNPKYHLLVNAWKRLPLPVANLLGPVIARNLG